MVNKKNITDITLVVQSGGMIELSETGNLPRFLVFNSRDLRRTWRFKQREDTQNGVLKVNGQIAFNYFYEDLGCRMQSVTDGVVGEEWKIEEVLIEIRD